MLIIKWGWYIGLTFRNFFNSMNWVILSYIVSFFETNFLKINDIFDVIFCFEKRIILSIFNILILYAKIIVFFFCNQIVLYSQIFWQEIVKVTCKNLSITRIMTYLLHNPKIWRKHGHKTLYMNMPMTYC